MSSSPSEYVAWQKYCLYLSSSATMIVIRYTQLQYITRDIVITYHLSSRDRWLSSYDNQSSPNIWQKSLRRGVGEGRVDSLCSQYRMIHPYTIYISYGFNRYINALRATVVFCIPTRFISFINTVIIVLINIFTTRSSSFRGMCARVCVCVSVWNMYVLCAAWRSKRLNAHVFDVPSLRRLFCIASGVLWHLSIHYVNVQHVARV